MFLRSQFQKVSFSSKKLLSVASKQLVTVADKFLTFLLTVEQDYIYNREVEKNSSYQEEMKKKWLGTIGDLVTHQEPIPTFFISKRPTTKTDMRFLQYTAWPIDRDIVDVPMNFPMLIINVEFLPARKVLPGFSDSPNLYPILLFTLLYQTRLIYYGRELRPHVKFHLLPLNKT